MSIARVKASSLTQGLPKKKTILAGNDTILPGSYESIATVTLSSSQTNVSFTSIPSTYKHLQIRAISQTNRGTYAKEELKLNINSDTGANYSYHALVGTGAAAAAGSGTSQTYCYMDASSTATAAGSIFSAMVIDILDYANTNKYKTLRMLFGYDLNGTLATNTGTVTLQSNLWRSTSAISTLTFAPLNGTAFNQYSSFALYGIN